MPAQGTPTPPLVGGTNVRNPILQGYVFQSGIHKPEHSNILTYKYPQYYITSLMERMGAYEGVAQDIYSWNVMDRTRKGAVCATVGDVDDTASVDITTDIDYSSPNLGYFIVGDVLRFESGVLGRVTAVAEDTGKQEISVVQVDGTNWQTGDIATDDTVGHAFTAFGEASSAPNGRLYLPDELYNTLTILRRSFDISGSELTNRTYLGDGSSWFWEVEEINMKEFARDRELAILFGDRSTGAVKVSNGIWQYALDSGVVNGYASGTGIQESDLQEQVRALLVENVSNDIYILCGSNALKDIQVALRDYAVAGAMDFGRLGNNTAGLDFQSYKFMGKNLHFAYYELFDDSAALPVPQAGAGATDVDFSKTTLWLDFGSENNGRSLITMKYKEHDGISRRFVHAFEVGMVNAYGEQGGVVSSGDDKFTVHLLSEIGVEVRLPNRLGILKATS
jgi:hypothetical protein